MQLSNTKIGSVIQGGITESTNFRIEADGKMFRLLSDTLYQNKIGSMVREVSCNAVDAHIAAGKADIPFIIHAPTAMEPWFSVIDQGIGLSHDDVVNIFTCFGKSTKTDSNTMVGAFGFGSKTPFAYTNAFTVISVKDGIKNCYSAVIGEDGLPAMNLMGTEETTEGNGVEITVAVETYDFREFYNEIANQLRYFKVKPIITGKSIAFPNPYENVFETVDEHTHFRRSGNIEAVQGGVAYPIDRSQLEKGIGDNESLRKFVQGAVNVYNPILHFEIGMIAVTPSRESISYDTVTVKNILERLESVQATLIKRITEKMDEAKNPWDRAIFLKRNRDLYSKIVDFENNPWNVAVFGNDPYIALPPKFCNSIEVGDGRMQHTLTHYTPKETNKGNFRLSVNDAATKIAPGSDVAIIIDDGSGYSMSRIRRYIEETDNDVYFFSARFQKMHKIVHKLDDGSEETYMHYNNWIQGEIDPAMFTEFTNAVEGSNVIFLADLPKQERVHVIKNADGTETVKEKYVPAKAYKFSGFRNGMGFGYFKNYEKTFVAPKKMTEKTAYVIVDNRSIKTGLDFSAETFLKLAFNEEGFDLPIYAIRENDVKKIADNPNWIPLVEAVKNLRIELEAKYKPIQVRMALRYSGEAFNRIGGDNGMNHFIKHKEKIEDGLFRGMLTRYARYHKRKLNVNNDICNFLYAESMEKIRERQQLKDKKRQTAIMNRYPILSMLGTGYYGNHATEKTLNQYINAVNLIYKN